MNENQKYKIGIAALGLIGGSIAMTVRKKFPDSEIVALNRSEEPLRQALSDGVIDHGSPEVDEHFRDCDFIFLCAPVSVNIRYFSDLLPFLGEKTILTDVGSVKSGIHEAAERLIPSARFIGGHPMAGSEKSGYENANDHLLENAYYILTPSPGSRTEDVERYREFVTGLGAIPLVLSPEKHDFITAAVSHVPHMAAYTLVRLIEESDSPEQYMKAIAAGGFKDITRIASSDPTMWEQICLSNPGNIGTLLQGYIDRLSEVRDLIRDGEGEKLHALFEHAKEYRDSVPDTHLGPIEKIYDLHCDIIDEAGAIATIATILSTQGVSIRNIGIVHNRTYEEGALHIEFYDEASSETAATLLKRHGYTVYGR